MRFQRAIAYFLLIHTFTILQRQSPSARASHGTNWCWLFHSPKDCNTASMAVLKCMPIGALYWKVTYLWAAPNPRERSRPSFHPTEEARRPPVRRCLLEAVAALDQTTATGAVIDIIDAFRHPDVFAEGDVTPFWWLFVTIFFCSAFPLERG